MYKKTWFTKIQCKKCTNVGVYKIPQSLNYHCPNCGETGLFQSEKFELLQGCDLKPIQGEWIWFPCPDCDQTHMIYRFNPSGLVQCPKCDKKLWYKLGIPVKTPKRAIKQRR